MSEIIRNRYDYILLFDVIDGNPNGDPDADNLPRIDPETGAGLVTDVCIKRKIRNYLQIIKRDKENYDILVKSKEFSGEEAIINKSIRESFEKLGIDLNTAKTIDGLKRENKGRSQGTETNEARKYICSRFFDVRTFGAVLNTGANAGQVRGPIQMTFARSIDPVVYLNHTLTVCSARKEEESYESQIGIQGRKYTIPYGLYSSYGFISAHLAAQTGFNEDDLGLFWDALKNMFDHDHSAARGMMNTRKLIVFKHNTALGNAPAHQLFDAVKVEKINQDKSSRSFDDYKVTIDKSKIPAEVELIEMV